MSEAAIQKRDPMNSLELEMGSKTCSFNTGKIPVLLFAFNHRGYYSLPIRILALNSSTTESINVRYDVKYSESVIDCNLKKIVDWITGCKPSIVGFSINIWNRDITFELIRELKQSKLKIATIAGGQEMTNSVIDYLNFIPELDYIIDGEGELPFIQFLGAWNSGNHCLIVPDKVSGLHYRKGGKTVLTRPADTVICLEKIPSVILNGLINPKKIGPIGVLLEGTRGCPFRCSFCFEALRKTSTVSAPVERLINEIEYMVSSGVSSFHIMDPILCNGNTERLKNLSLAIKALSKKYRKIINISVEVYADRISDEIAEWIGSFSAIDVGLQSTNPETLKAINRSYSKKKFCEGVYKLKKTNSIISIYLIIGLPYETFQSCLTGIKFVVNLQPTKLFINELILLNGTELRRRAEEYGYDYDATPPYIIKSNNWITNIEFSILNKLSADLVRRYNLSFEAFPQINPLFTIIRDQECSTLKVCLNGSCSCRCIDNFTCRNKTHIEDTGFELMYKQANNKNIEFIVDAAFPLSKLLHHAVQFQLSGANRMSIYAPISYFSEMNSISKMVNSGIWHFNPAVNLNPCLKLNIDIAVLTILENMRKTFPVQRRGHLRPYLELILLTEGLAIKDIRTMLEQMRIEADSIAFPDINIPADAEDRSDLLDLFVSNMGVHKRRKAGPAPPRVDHRMSYWIKLRTDTAHLILNELCKLNIDASVIKDLFELGLTYADDFPSRCFNYLKSDI